MQAEVFLWTSCCVGGDGDDGAAARSVHDDRPCLGGGSFSSRLVLQFYIDPDTSIRDVEKLLYWGFFSCDDSVLSGGFVTVVLLLDETHFDNFFSEDDFGEKLFTTEGHLSPRPLPNRPHHHHPLPTHLWAWAKEMGSPHPPFSPIHPPKPPT